MGNIAYHFGFGATEVMEMELRDILYWHRQLERIMGASRG
jgi:hypothetical protein